MLTTMLGVALKSPLVPVLAQKPLSATTLVLGPTLSTWVVTVLAPDRLTAAFRVRTRWPAPAM